MKRAISVFVIITFILLTLSGCSKKITSGKDFEYPIDNEPVCLDPQITSDPSSVIIIKNCMEALTRIDKNNNIASGVAKSWDISSDKLVYTFHLRENAKWHLTDDIKKMLTSNFSNSITADDFVFALTRAVTPSTYSPTAQNLFDIKNAEEIFGGQLSPSKLGVKATDSHTLVITLKSPDPDFLRLTSTELFMPCNRLFFNLTKGRYGLDAELLMCNGPFYLSKWTHDTSAVIKKNGDYAGDNNVVPSSVTFTIDKDADSRISNLKSGTYDGTPLIGTQTDTVSEYSGVNLTQYTDSTWVIAFNCNDSVMSSPYIRLAICQSMGNIPNPPSQYFSAASGIIPESCQFSSASYRTGAGVLPIIGKNTAAAKSNWKTGLEKLKTDSLTITLMCPTEYESIMRQIIQYWQQNLGMSLNVIVKPLSDADVIKNVKSGNYQAAFYPITSDTEYALGFLKKFTSNSSGNFIKYKSDEYNNLIQNMKSTADASAALKQLKNAEIKLLESYALYPIYSEKRYIATAKGVSGIYFGHSTSDIYFISAEKAK